MVNTSTTYSKEISPFSNQVTRLGTTYPQRFSRSMKSCVHFILDFIYFYNKRLSLPKKCQPHPPPVLRPKKCKPRRVRLRLQTLGLDKPEP